MTGGVAVILGRTGRNFAAGMSGGIAFVLDEESRFGERCNHGMVELEAVQGRDDIALLRSLLQRHRDYTGSAVAERLLAEWPGSLERFVKVMPVDYKRVLTARQSNKVALVG